MNSNVKIENHTDVFLKVENKVNGFVKFKKKEKESQAVTEIFWPEHKMN